jgi:hypothetical protein
VMLRDSDGDAIVIGEGLLIPYSRYSAHFLLHVAHHQSCTEGHEREPAPSPKPNYRVVETKEEAQTGNERSKPGLEMERSHDTCRDFTLLVP